MPFKFESDMVEPAIRWLHSLGLQTKHEFPTPWGICDLVGLAFRKQSVAQRLRLGQRDPIGPPLRIAILCRLPDVTSRRSMSLDQLYSDYESVLDLPRITQELQKLANAHFVRITKTGRFQRATTWLPFHKRIVAVELKLARIEDVVSQAVNNQSFAAESYVGLPADVAERTLAGTKAELFRRTGVGLLSVGPRGCNMLLRANRRAPANMVLEVHCAERFWRTYARGS